jgi:hypothetical protein
MTKEAGFSLFRIHTESAQEAINNTERDIQDYNEWLRLKDCSCAQKLLDGGEYDIAFCECSAPTQVLIEYTANSLQRITSEVVPQTTLTVLGLKMALKGRPRIPAKVAYDVYRHRDMSKPYQPSKMDKRIDRFAGIHKLRDDYTTVSVTNEYTVRVTDQFVAPETQEESEERVLFDYSFQPSDGDD